MLFEGCCYRDRTLKDLSFLDPGLDSPVWFFVVRPSDTTHPLRYLPRTIGIWWGLACSPGRRSIPERMKMPKSRSAKLAQLPRRIGVGAVVVRIQLHSRHRPGCLLVPHPRMASDVLGRHRHGPLQIRSRMVVCPAATDADPNTRLATPIEPRRAPRQYVRTSRNDQGVVTVRRGVGDVSAVCCADGDHSARHCAMIRRRDQTNEHAKLAGELPAGVGGVQAVSSRGAIVDAPRNEISRLYRVTGIPPRPAASMIMTGCRGPGSDALATHLPDAFWDGCQLRNVLRQR
jgi:hypothetical protein